MPGSGAGAAPKGWGPPTSGFGCTLESGLYPVDGVMSMYGHICDNIIHYITCNIHNVCTLRPNYVGVDTLK